MKDDIHPYNLTHVWCNGQIREVRKVATLSIGQQNGSAYQIYFKDGSFAPWSECQLVTEGSHTLTLCEVDPHPE
jgi:hypothetical protein